MATNWRKIYAMKKQAEDKLNKICPDLQNYCGIYILTRDDESGIPMCYIGQAKHLKDRLISHINGYSQRIDISLKKRGFYDEFKRPYGWKLDYIYTLERELDDYEEKYIKDFALRGFQLYNKTAGKQGVGKVGINDGTSNKGYRDGLKKGYENCLKDIKEYFDKYLYFAIKTDSEVYRKPKNKAERESMQPLYKEIYLKKLAEFENLMKGENNEREGIN